MYDIFYNPSFLSDRESMDRFAVRTAELQKILAVIRQGENTSSQHVLVAGDRGCGKTSLVRRAVAELRRSPEFAGRWLPLTFGEESYEATSVGQFWLEAVLRLAAETADPALQKVHDAILHEPDEKLLQQRCLAALLEFAGRTGKRLVLIVENVDLLLREQLGRDGAQQLCATLEREPLLMLVGSASGSFDACRMPRAMNDFFQVIELAPLSVQECRSLWNTAAGKDISRGRARAVHVATNGNLRLTAILAAIEASSASRSFWKNLELLVDSQTSYFKSVFEALPAKERKIFACLASIWNDGSAREVAAAARVSPSLASACLKRLEVRGLVRVATARKGKRKYRLTDRLCNIYYLLRRGKSQNRVRALADFMVHFYGGAGLDCAPAETAGEACLLIAPNRQEHWEALHVLFALPGEDDRLTRLLAPLDVDGVEKARPVHPAADAGRRYDVLAASLQQAYAQADWQEVQRLLHSILDLNPGAAWVWKMLGGALARAEEASDEAVACLRKALELQPGDAQAMFALGVLLAEKCGKSKEGVDHLRRAVEARPGFASAWFFLGDALARDLGELQEGAKCLQQALTLDPQDLWTRCALGFYLLLDGRVEESGQVLRGTSAQEQGGAEIVTHLVRRTRDFIPAEYMELLLEYTERPAILLNHFAYKLTHMGRYGEVERIEGWAREAVQANPKAPAYRGTLSRALALRGKCSEALEHAAFSLAHPDIIQSETQEPTDVLAMAAAAGLGREALDELVESESRPLLEPLEAGLRLCLGLEIDAPLEIQEVGRDVAARIEEWSQWFAAGA